jgi:hypothetical protein
VTKSSLIEGLIECVCVSLATPLLPAALRISSASQAMYKQEELFLLIAIRALLSMS